MPTTALTLLDGLLWDGRPVPGERTHALLGALALVAPRPVPVGDLIEVLWPDDLPSHPEKALQVLVSRTRSRTSPEAVVLDGAGYRLGLRDDEVDLLRLRRLVAEARAAHAAGDLDVARLAAREAVAVPVRPDGEGPVGELARAAARERAAAARLLGRVLLARGETAEALPLLEAAHAQDPTDEDRLVDLLRAESAERGLPAALDRYASYAAGVRDRLGADPGEPLRRLHAELLARDAPVRQGLTYDAAPLVGRDADVAALRGLLSQARVVSIVGAGGLGKTRMANLVGRLAEQPVVHLVELAGVTAPEGVLREVGAALGVRESVARVRTAGRGSDLRGRVAEQLDRAPTLLVLDNCEHLVAAVADLVAYLVAVSPSTRVLTTSRAPLGIAAEQVYLLPQLGVDDAVELFAQRARASRPGVRLEREEVAALVGRLDGLPLAIELAAAKVRVMAVAEITRRLADRFALLAGRDRSAPERHQTLETVIAWSWNLLRTEDQRALQALSVFPDGFALDGAEALLGADPLASLAELVDQSLLVVREGDRVRYRFLETVREYGLKQLAEVGRADGVRRLLQEWAVDVARRANRRLFGHEQVAAMADLRAEVGNLAGALRVALDAEDVADVVPLAGALTAFWTVSGQHLTVLGIAAPVLDLLVAHPLPEAQAPDERAELRAVMASLAVNLLVFTGRPVAAALDRIRALGLAGDGGRADAMVRVLLGVYGDGAADVAALDRLCADPDPHVAAMALRWASQVHENNGEVERAVTMVERALLIDDGDDGPWLRALLEAQACGLATQLGDWERAVGHARRALPVFDALGADEDAMQLRGVLALADLSAGRLDAAQEALDRIGRDERGSEQLSWTVTALTGQAELALARGDVDRGLGLYRQCLVIAREQRFGEHDAPVELMPWALFAETAALVAAVVHGRAATADDLAVGSFAKIDQLLAAVPGVVDFPILGGMLMAHGTWLLSSTPAAAPDEVAGAVRLVALGHRFGYYRSLPTMAWATVRTVVDRVAPGALDDTLAAYAGRSSTELVEEARAAAAATASYMARR